MSIDLMAAAFGDALADAAIAARGRHLGIAEGVAPLSDPRPIPPARLMRRLAEPESAESIISADALEFLRGVVSAERDAVTPADADRALTKLARDASKLISGAEGRAR